MKILEDYEMESGQKLNKDKTSLFFRKNTSKEVQDRVKRIFEAQIIQHHEKYLRLPPLVGRCKKKAFNCIKDHASKIKWVGKLQGGKVSCGQVRVEKFSLKRLLKPPPHTQ